MKEVEVVSKPRLVFHPSVSTRERRRSNRAEEGRQRVRWLVLTASMLVVILVSIPEYLAVSLTARYWALASIILLAAVACVLVAWPRWGCARLIKSGEAFRMPADLADEFTELEIQFNHSGRADDPTSAKQFYYTAMRVAKDHALKLASAKRSEWDVAYDAQARCTQGMKDLAALCED